jgi:hypothetical protein
MAYSSFLFPPSTLLYPPASTVQAYLESFTNHFNLRPYIRFNTRVLTAGWDHQRNNRKGRWVVTTSESETHEFDLLLVCNGHHNIPRYPSTPGISSWIDSKRAFHSIFFRNPTSVPLPPDSRTLKNLTILVVGGGPSGQDITQDLLPFAGRVLHSTSSYSPPLDSTPTPTTSAIPKPRPTQFTLPSDPKLPGTVTFEDSSQEQVDFCILATGYQVDFPFFDQGIEPSPESDPPKFYLPKCLPPRPLTPHLDTQKMHNTTYSVFPLARQLLAFPSSLPPSSSEPKPLESSKSNTTPKTPPPTPTLAFLGLLVRVVPFPLVEVQARIVVELFAAYSESEVSGPKFENPDPDVHLRTWDWDAEAHLALDRYEMLGKKFDVVSASIPSVNTLPINIDPVVTSTPTLDANRHTYIHKQYPRFEPMDQYDYREKLEAIIASLSSPPLPISPSSPILMQPKRLASHRALYALKAPLREAWRDIVARGEAEAWVLGVGARDEDGVGKVGHDNGINGLESRAGSMSLEELAEEEWVDLMWRVLKWWAVESAS